MEQSIPNKYLILDKRSEKDFTNYTFSNFPIKQIINNLNKSLLDNKLRESINYAIELSISGYSENIWDKIITIGIRNININNPKIPFFIYNRYLRYHHLLNYYHILDLRNSQEFRNLLVDVIFIIANSPKGKLLSFNKIKDEDFHMTYIVKKFKATNSSFINNKLKYGDPEETKIILNEFNFNLINKNFDLCVYWLSWILEWEKRCKKNKKEFNCGYREIKNIDRKYHNDIVWFIWEIIIQESKKLSEFTIVNIEALYKLYKFDFKPSKKSKRNFFFIYAIKYFTDQYYINKYPSNYHIMLNMCMNINNLFFEKMKYAVNDDKILEKKRYEDNILHINKIKKKNPNKANNINITNIKFNKLDEIDNLILSKK